MTNSPQEFISVPTVIEAWKITHDNLDAVAKWCGGKRKGESITFPKIRDRSKILQNGQDNNHFAIIGSVIVRRAKGFDLYTPQEFDRSFRPARKRVSPEETA